MNFQRLYLFIVPLFLIAMSVQADVMYRCVDESGHSTYQNVRPITKDAKCTIVVESGSSGGNVPAPKASAAKTPTPAAFPKVDDNAQKSRDTDRRRILDSELAAEQKNLDQAKRDLAEQETTVLPSERMQGGAISGGKLQERLQPFKDKAALHERNIEAIQKEISKLR